MVISVRISNEKLTYITRSVKGEHTHSNLQSVRANQGAKVMHFRQIQRANLELETARKIDSRLVQANDRKAKRANKRLTLEVGQILARQ